MPPDRPHENSLFFALLPDPDASGLIEQVAKNLWFQYDLFHKPTLWERLHVSLNPLGSFSETLPTAIAAAAEQAAATIRAAPFEITFDQRLSFRNGKRRALVLVCSDGAAPVIKLYENLDQALKKAGLGSGRRLPKLTPHITLLRDYKNVPPGPLDKPITWVVNEFVLVHSFRDQKRQRYHKYLGRWPLHI